MAVTRKTLRRAAAAGQGRRARAFVAGKTGGGTKRRRTTRATRTRRK